MSEREPLVNSEDLSSESIDKQRAIEMVRRIDEREKLLGPKRRRGFRLAKAGSVGFLGGTGTWMVATASEIVNRDTSNQFLQGLQYGGAALAVLGAAVGIKGIKDFGKAQSENMRGFTDDIRELTPTDPVLRQMGMEITAALDELEQKENKR